jgi:hypothetical protein
VNAVIDSALEAGHPLRRGCPALLTAVQMEKWKEEVTKRNLNLNAPTKNELFKMVIKAMDDNSRVTEVTQNANPINCMSREDPRLRSVQRYVRKLQLLTIAADVKNVSRTATYETQFHYAQLYIRLWIL